MRKLVFSVVALLGLAAIPQSIVSQQANANTNFKSIDINVSGKSSTGTTRVLLPTLTSPLPVVVLSHSRIDFGDATVDLMPMAEKLARDGYAVLVLDRTMIWPLKDAETNRDGYELLENTEKWALEHIKFDPRRFAYVGPNFDTGKEPYPMQSLPRDRRRVERAIRFHLGEPANSENTEMLRTTTGQHKLVQFIVRNFKPKV